MRTIRVINNILTVHFENELSFFLSYAPPVLTLRRNTNNEVTLELGPLASGYFQFAPFLSDIEKVRFLLGHMNNVPIGTKTDMHKVLDTFALGEIQANVVFIFNDSGIFETPVGGDENSYSSILHKS
ncbi:hypothetical protein [Legionella shakespearei]|nr:hypothetical protein [Legionella shakespearei]